MRARRSLLPPLLRPGWLDEGRRVAQEPVFRAAAAQGPPRGRVLNAGCGEGLYSGFLESFTEVDEIIDLDLTLPDVSARRSDPRHTDEAGSVTALPFADGSLDWILCSEVIEHVEDDRAAARELGRVLGRDRFALVSVPTPPAPYDPAHVREGYSLQAMQQLLASADLEVVWHRYCFHAPMRWLVSIWRWQHQRLGHGRRSLMPRLAVLAFGYSDRWLRIGRPWDLVVLARRR